MNTPDGVLKVAAKRIGISYDTYIAKLAAGERHCTKCKQWKSIEMFGKDRTRSSGLDTKCTKCRQTNKEGPSKIERRQMRAQGMAWCRDCKVWFCTNPGAQHRGYCQECINRKRRERYAVDSDFRHRLRRHAYQRKRQVNAVPPEGEEHLLELFEGMCAYCGAPADTWDHIYPVSRGGKTTPGNILPACRSCNSSKGDQDVCDWIERMGIHVSEILLDRLAFMDASLFG